MAPKNCSSLYGEISYLGKTQQPIKQITTHAIEETKKLFDITDKEILTKKIIHIPRAYVLYDFWRERYLKKIHQRLNEHNVQSIGRYEIK